jgi:hypothetical protein
MRPLGKRMASMTISTRQQHYLVGSPKLRPPRGCPKAADKSKASGKGANGLRVIPGQRVRRNEHLIDASSVRKQRARTPRASRWMAAG